MWRWLPTSGPGHEPRGCLGGACPRVGPLLVSRDGGLDGYRARLGFAAVWAVSGGSTWGWVVSPAAAAIFWDRLSPQSRSVILARLGINGPRSVASRVFRDIAPELRAAIIGVMRDSDAERLS